MTPLRKVQEELAKYLVKPTHKDIESIAELTGFDARELARSAETLFRKRLAQTRTLLPKTTIALGESYSTIFRPFHEEFHFDGHRAPILDAIAFSDFIRKRVDLASWIVELARWESLPLRWRMKSIYCSWEYFEFDVMNGSMNLSEANPPKRRPSRWLAICVGRWRKIMRVW